MRREPLLAGTVRRSRGSDDNKRSVAFILTLVVVCACLVLYMGYNGRAARGGKMGPVAPAGLRGGGGGVVALDRVAVGAPAALPAPTAVLLAGPADAGVAKDLTALYAASAAHPPPVAHGAEARVEPSQNSVGAGQAGHAVASATQSLPKPAAKPSATQPPIQAAAAAPPPTPPDPAAAASLYDLPPIPDATGGVLDPATLRGRAVLVVNTASACGFTDANLRGLQALYQKYEARGLTVLAFPCNAFGGQEPHDARGAAAFARAKYGATFPIMAKVEVDGPAASPVFTFLRSSSTAAASLGGAVAAQAAAWNFEKVLTDRGGVPVARFGSAFDAAALEAAVERVLGPAFVPTPQMNGAADRPGPSGSAAGPGASGSGASAAPLYGESHVDASVLACWSPALADFLLTAPAREQLHWLHSLHVAVDDVLQRVPAIKVGLDGAHNRESMLFVSGTENSDADHVATLVALARELAATTARLRLPNGRMAKLQMGLHSGEVATGVVGSLPLRYGVFGPTVMAARALEAASAPGVLRASEEAYRRLGQQAGSAWRPGGSVRLAPSAVPVPTRLLGDDADLAPLASLRAVADAVGEAWDPRTRRLPSAAADDSRLRTALDAARACNLAAADVRVFATALAVSVAAAAWATGACATPSPAAAAAACLLLAGALAASLSPHYAGAPRDALAGGLRALAAAPRAWRAYAGVPCLVRGLVDASGGRGGALARSAGAAGAGVAAALAGLAPGTLAGLAAGVPQLVLAALVPVPAGAAARSAPVCAALAAAQAAPPEGAGRAWWLDAVAAYAMVGVAAPLGLQAVADRLAAARTLRRLAS